MKLVREKLKALGERLALAAVARVSTMTCVGVFLLWSVLPLWLPQITNLVAYVSSDVLQLVLLPLIMVGQKISSDRSRKHHDHTNQRQDRMDQLLLEMHRILAAQSLQTTLLNEIVKDQARILDDLSHSEIHGYSDSEAGS